MQCLCIAGEFVLFVDKYDCKQHHIEQLRFALSMKSKEKNPLLISYRKDFAKSIHYVGREGPASVKSFSVDMLALFIHLCEF